MVVVAHSTGKDDDENVDLSENVYVINLSTLILFCCDFFLYCVDLFFFLILALQWKQFHLSVQE